MKLKWPYKNKIIRRITEMDKLLGSQELICNEKQLDLKRDKNINEKIK